MTMLRLRVPACCLCAAIFLSICLFGGVAFARAETWDDLRETLEPGLDLAVIPFNTELGSSEELALLRLDPQVVDLDLLMSSELGIEPLTPEAWAETYDLLGVINASMYLSNLNTSTGYMRRGQFVNNGNIAARFGAFFVAGFKGPSRPGRSDPSPAAILDRDADAWEALLPEYNVVVQNFRIINAEGGVLWGNSDKRHSVAALGEDEDGYLYFIHTPGLVSVPEFVRLLSGLPLKFTRLMYVEGGRPATLHVRTARLTRTWMGRYANFLQDDAGSPPLPNVIVVKRKAEQRAE